MTAATDTIMQTIGQGAITPAILCAIMPRFESPSRAARMLDLLHEAGELSRVYRSGVPVYRRPGEPPKPKPATLLPSQIAARVREGTLRAKMAEYVAAMPWATGNELFARFGHLMKATNTCKRRIMAIRLNDLHASGVLDRIGSRSEPRYAIAGTPKPDDWSETK